VAAAGSTGVRDPDGPATGTSARGAYEERAAAAGTVVAAAALVREDAGAGACAGVLPGKVAAPPPAPDREDPTAADVPAEDAADADATADPDRPAKGAYVKGACARCDAVAAVAAVAAAGALVREDAGTGAGACAGAGARPAEVVALPPAPDREDPAAADVPAEDAANADAGARPEEVVVLPLAPDREDPAAADISAEDAAAAVEDCAPANPALISPHTYSPGSRPSSCACVATVCAVRHNAARSSGSS
jgi:hypothetical protein